MWKKIINLMLVVILIYSLVQIGSKQSQYRQGEKTYQVIQQVAKMNTNGEEKTNHQKLSKMNPDYKCWIEIENTDIDYPIVQGGDNEFYLNHDFNGKSSINGSLFMDYRNSWPNDQNTIIYGHNMRNGTMFQELEKYKVSSFFKSKNQIIISDKTGDYYYEVFSVYVIEDGVEILVPFFKSDEEYSTYLEDVRERSLYSSKLDISVNDKIITLFTCSYEFKQARTVVHAKLVKKI